MAAAETTAEPTPSSTSRALRKRYGANEVLKGIDLDVARAAR